jgi:hypothetical protein
MPRHLSSSRKASIDVESQRVESVSTAPDVVENAQAGEAPCRDAGREVLPGHHEVSAGVHRHRRPDLDAAGERVDLELIADRSTRGRELTSSTPSPNASLRPYQVTTNAPPSSTATAVITEREQSGVAMERKSSPGIVPWQSSITPCADTHRRGLLDRRSPRWKDDRTSRQRAPARASKRARSSVQAVSLTNGGEGRPWG